MSGEVPGASISSRKAVSHANRDVQTNETRGRIDKALVG